MKFIPSLSQLIGIFISGMKGGLVNIDFIVIYMIG